MRLSLRFDQDLRRRASLLARIAERARSVRRPVGGGSEPPMSDDPAPPPADVPSEETR